MTQGRSECSLPVDPSMCRLYNLSALWFPLELAPSREGSLSTLRSHPISKAEIQSSHPLVSVLFSHDFDWVLGWKLTGKPRSGTVNSLLLMPFWCVSWPPAPSRPLLWINPSDTWTPGTCSAALIICWLVCLLLHCLSLSCIFDFGLSHRDCSCLATLLARRLTLFD